VIEVGQGDIAPSAVLHIPSLDAVVAGDVAYNQIHLMLALGRPAEWDKWIASIRIIVALRDVVERLWAYARTFLRVELGQSGD
jgi:hypothetical protein